MTAIYVLIDPRDGSIRYVGKTSRLLEVRLSVHMGPPPPKSDGRRDRWVRKLRRLGMRASIEPVQFVPDDFADEAERYWIAYFRNIGCDLVNGTDGGTGGHMVGEALMRLRKSMASPMTKALQRESHLDRKLPPETKAAMKEAQRLRRGRELAEGTTRKFTSEERARISERQRGVKRRPLSPETKAKIGASHRGKTLTEEHKAKIGATTRARKDALNQGMRGKHHSEETRAKLSRSVSEWWKAQHA
jgi:hypothetical protein